MTDGTHTTKRPPSRRAFLVHEETTSLANGIFETFPSLEGGDFHCGDRNLLCRVAWVHTHARGAIGDTKCTKTRDCHGATLLELARDRPDERLECVRRGALRDTRSTRNGVDEILLGHEGRLGRGKTTRILAIDCTHTSLLSLAEAKERRKILTNGFW